MDFCDKLSLSYSECLITDSHILSACLIVEVTNPVMILMLDRS